MLIPVAYLAVIMIWSTTPLAIKWSSEIGFLPGVSIRMLLGTIVCLSLVTVLRLEFPWHRAARQSYFAVSLMIYGAMLATYWGAQFIPSGLVSVLFGTTPIVTSLLTAFWLKNTRLTINNWLGMLLGLVGLSVIFNHQLHIEIAGVKGLLAMLVAVTLHAISAVWIKQINAALSPLVMTAGGLLVALPLYGITWLITGDAVPLTIPSRALWSIVYLGILGSVVGFILYYYVLKHVDATRTALITLITPIIALLLGHSLNGEVISLAVWIGSSIVLLGLALYHWGNISSFYHTQENSHW